jgi:hypothetical protein
MGMSTVAPRGLWQTPGHSIDNYWAYGTTNSLGTSTSNSALWPATDLVIYVPVRVKQRVVAVKLWFGSGAVGTGNVQVGIYDQLGARQIATATTAKQAALDEQVIDITDTTIGPGLYYLALQCSNATDTFFGSPLSAPLPVTTGVRTQAVAFGLPATATWVVNQTHAFVPCVGMLVEGTLA